MIFGNLIKELADRLDAKNVDDETVKSLLSRKINESYKEIARIFKWEHLKRSGELVIRANYSTGTVTITKDSRTITGSGTTWTASMVGRYFQSSASGNWYRIIRFVSATELTLQSQVLESSGSGLTYTICQRIYYLPSDVRTVKLMGKWIAPGEIEARSENYLQDLTQNIFTTGEPEDFAPYGADPFESSYTQGTVTLTVDNNLMVGIGTAWFDNVEAGDIVNVSGKVFRVKRVESDTRIVLLNYSTISVPVATYSIEKDVRVGFSFYPSAGADYIIPYSYYKRAFDMVNDKDRPELPEDFDIAIIDGAEASRMRDLDDAKWIQKQLEFTARIKDLRATHFVHTMRNQQLRPVITKRA